MTTSTPEAGWTEADMMTIKQQALWHVIRITLIMIGVSVVMAASLYYLGLVITGLIITLWMLGYVMRMTYQMELRRLEDQSRDTDRGR